MPEQGCGTGSDLPRCALVCYGCSTAILQMATSASQTYIARLGFQDRDRSNERHGLACEYLFERMLELEMAPWWLQKQRKEIEEEISYREKAAAGEQLRYYISEQDRQEMGQQLPAWRHKLQALTFESVLEELRNTQKTGDCLNVPIASRSYVNGFADVLLRHGNERYSRTWLGEVKITKEPAENVLQQVNFYMSYLSNVGSVYIVTDYDPGDLKRLCAGTKIKVYRLGQVFEQWLANRTTPATEEL